MHEVSEAAKLITQSADSNAKIIFGAVINPDLKDEVRITVIATGFSERALSSISEANLSASGGYVPSQFIETSSRQPERPREIKRLQKQEPKKNPPRRPVEKPVVDEELDITAFIRKKMK